MGRKGKTAPRGARALRGFAAAEQELRLAFRLVNERLVRAVGELRALADEQNVATGAHREHRRLLDLVAVSERAHLEIVREKDPAEADLAAQELRRDTAAQRGRHTGIERIVDDVSGHDGPHHGSDAAEGDELDGLEPIARVRDGRQSEMAVDRRVAMSGKVLGAREHTARLQAVDERAPHLPDANGVAAERPIADDGVLRIAVDVHHGGERQVDPHRQKLDPDDRTRPARETRQIEPPDQAHRGELHGGLRDP